MMMVSHRATHELRDLVDGQVACTLFYVSECDRMGNSFSQVIVNRAKFAYNTELHRLGVFISLSSNTFSLMYHVSYLSMAAIQEDPVCSVETLCSLRIHLTPCADYCVDVPELVEDFEKEAAAE